MDYIESSTIVVNVKRPIAILRAIITAADLRARWKGMSEDEIAKLIPSTLTAYKLLKTHCHPDGGSAYVCAKGVFLGSVYSGLLSGLAFDEVQVLSYEKDHPESAWPVTREAGPQDAVVEDFKDSPPEPADGTLPTEEEILVAVMRYLGKNEREIASALDLKFPGLSHPQVGLLLAEEGDRVNPIANKKRGQRARGKAK